MGVDALLAVDADPAELDLTQIVAAIAVVDVSVIAHFVLLGFVDSVAAVRSHYFGQAHRRQSHSTRAAPARLHNTLEAAVLVAVIALFVVVGLELPIPTN